MPHAWTAAWAKFCPRCGEAGLTTSDGRRHTCAACGFLYFHNPAAAVCALLRHEDALALVVRGKNPAIGMLDLPGGFVDPGESLEEALHRELAEELGLAITNPCYRFSLPNTYHYAEVDYWTVDAMFEVWLPERVNPTPDGREVLALQWFALADIPLERLAFASGRAAITRLRAESDVT